MFAFPVAPVMDVADFPPPPVTVTVSPVNDVVPASTAGGSEPMGTVPSGAHAASRFLFAVIVAVSLDIQQMFCELSAPCQNGITEMMLFAGLVTIGISPLNHAGRFGAICGVPPATVYSQLVSGIEMSAFGTSP